MAHKAHDDQELYSDVFETNGFSGQSVAEVAGRIRGSDTSLIALDGLPGAGKSTLAARLSALLSIRTVHLDDYLAQESVGFTDYLRYEELQRALLRRPVIVEGVCMLDVLDRLELRPDPLVYLHAPFAERHLDRSHPVVREVRAYTDRTHPAERANLVLTRSESAAKRYETGAARRFSIDACLMRNRSQIAAALAAAGMIMLAMGVISVVVGSTAHGGSATQVVGGDLSGVGIGLLTMLISSICIFLARSALPARRVPRSPGSKD
jgi:hypothetical protein